MLNQKLKYFF